VKNLGRALADLHAAELELADEYRRVADRHRVEHDVFHLARTLASQCESHARELAPHAADYGEEVDAPSGPGLRDTVLGPVRRKAAELAGRDPAGGLLLLDDLRRLYLVAEEALIDATMASQGARAAHDKELASALGGILADLETQTRWLKTRVKTAAPQALALG